MMNTRLLEDIAVSLRKTLGMDTTTILNPTHVEELSKNIDEKLEGFKVVRSTIISGIVLENQENFTLYIDNTKDSFYNLVKELAFALLLDKKSLNHYELQHSEFAFPRRVSDEVEYLWLAIMMPYDAYNSAILKYSSLDGTRVSGEIFEKENNKYCYLRGQQLHFW